MMAKVKNTGTPNVSEGVDQEQLEFSYTADQRVN